MLTGPKKVLSFQANTPSTLPPPWRVTFCMAMYYNCKERLRATTWKGTLKKKTKHTNERHKQLFQILNTLNMRVFVTVMKAT